MIRQFLTALLLLATPAISWAQLNSANSPIQITDIKPSLEKSPEFSVGVGPQRKSVSQDWLWVEVAFTYKGMGQAPTMGQSDEIAFNYYILLKNTSPQNRTGTLLTGVITHTGVTPGTDVHHSVALISPQTLKSFFNGKPPASIAATVQAVGVTASIRGQLAAEVSTGPGKNKPSWWQTFQQGPPGLVLSKDQTPFAPLFYDYFEAVKAKGAAY
jgi:hypothetical protein